jgi:hypothetical protein
MKRKQGWSDITATTGRVSLICHPLHHRFLIEHQMHSLFRALPLKTKILKINLYQNKHLISKRQILKNKGNFKLIEMIALKLLEERNANYSQSDH